MSLRDDIRQTFHLLYRAGRRGEAFSVPTAAYWRERILDVIYRSVALLGFIAYLPSVYLAFVEKLWWLVAFNTIGYGWFVWAALFRRPSSPVRSGMLLAFIYLLGVALLVKLGPFAAGPFWLFTFPVMTSLLFGLGPAVAALLLNALTVTGFGFMLMSAQPIIDFMPPNMASKWWVISANFLLLDTVVTLSIGVLLRGLNTALGEQREMRRTLEEKHAELQRANAKLKREFDERQRAEKEIKHFENQLRQAQKMEAIGTLAGGIAHDFNNILAAVLGYAEIALEEARGRSPLNGYLSEILKASHRAKDLTRQILTFSRQAEVAPKPVRLQGVVREAVKLLRASLPTTIAIEENLDCDATVMADPTQLHQVVMNLATNAAHAMEEQGGVLSILLEEVSSGIQPLPGPDRAEACRKVRLTVVDTGPGIDPSIRDRIFEPYFTTKGKGKGTGMGLSVVHGIVKNYGGDIEVESTPGKGAAFRVTFPVQPLATVVPQPPSPSEAASGHEHILVVDDEPQIAQVLTLMLESLGYRVTAFTRSRDAWRAFEQTPRSFDLLLTDMTMPDLTGEALSRAVLEKRPDMPIILCTGFHEQMNEERAQRIGIRSLVYKPMLRSTLAKEVRRVLDG